jgi:hypothetical protein
VRQGTLIAMAAALVLVTGPLLLSLMGWIRTRSTPEDASEPVKPWNWRLTINSALLYALAFNLIFFIQELFLVLPKALTPGLRPTLFHNNHSWEGENPLASLLQGTGALAILLTGVACAFFLRRGVGRSSTLRLFFIWMTYNGFFQSLPQVVIGAVNPRNDVGMAMDYLNLATTTKTAAALVALLTIPLLALSLLRPLLGLAEDPAYIANARARTRFVFHVGTLPVLSAIVLIIPFRVPRELVEVVILPVVVSVIGIAWLQAGAWRISRASTVGSSRVGSIAYPLSALLVLLLVFQLVLRPGIRFY